MKVASIFRKENSEVIMGMGLVEPVSSDSYLDLRVPVLARVRKCSRKSACNADLNTVLIAG